MMPLRYSLAAPRALLGFRRRPCVTGSRIFAEHVVATCDSIACTVPNHERSSGSGPPRARQGNQTATSNTTVIAVVAAFTLNELLSRNVIQSSCENGNTTSETQARRPRCSECGTTDSSPEDTRLAELVRMIRTDDAKRVISLIDEILPDVNAPINDSSDTALGVACAGGCGAVISVLLRNGADPKYANARGETCIALAAIEGHSKIVTKFSRVKGVDINQPDNFGRAPIHRAVALRHFDVAARLLDRGASSNLPTTGPLQERPLHVALHRISQHERTLQAKLPRYEAMEVLLGYGADPLLGDAHGDTPLHLCARTGDIIGIWLLLVEMEDAWHTTEVKNMAGVSVLQEADAWGLDAGIIVRLAVWLPRPVKRYLLSWCFWDAWAVLAAPTGGTARG